MPARISATISATDLFETLAVLGDPGLERVKTDFLTTVGLRIQQNAAEVQIIRNPNGPVHPTRLTNRRGGRGLVGSIAVDRRGLPREISVGSHFSYAPTHELGLGGYPVRAYLRPALEQEQTKFEATLARIWESRINQA